MMHHGAHALDSITLQRREWSYDLISEQLTIPGQRRQRGAQFVRHGRQEVALGLICRVYRHLPLCVTCSSQQFTVTNAAVQLTHERGIAPGASGHVYGAPGASGRVENSGLSLWTHEE